MILFQNLENWNKNWNIYKKNPSRIASKGVFGDSYRTQTCNLLIRSQMLYSIELRSRGGLDGESVCQ